MTVLHIITHPAILGATSGDDIVDLAMRLIGVAFGGPDEWPDKYGATFENDVFLMRPECWCWKDDGSCLYCTHGDHPQFLNLLRAKFPGGEYNEHSSRRYYDPPNFWYKPSNFRLKWYKYIGRDMRSNADSLPGDFLRRIFETHPTGITIDMAIDRLAQNTEQTRGLFDAMLNDLRAAAGYQSGYRPSRAVTKRERSH